MFCHWDVLSLGEGGIMYPMWFGSHVLTDCIFQLLLTHVIISTSYGLQYFMLLQSVLEGAPLLPIPSLCRRSPNLCQCI